MKTAIDGMFKDLLPGLEKSMDLTWRRNEAISSNVANAETPGYRAVDLNFAGELERAFNRQDNILQKTNEKHLDVTGNSQAHLSPDYSGVTKADGNNVDLDIQMGQMAFNRSKYMGAAALVRKRFLMLANAIRTGGS